MVNLKLNFYKPNESPEKGSAIHFDFSKNGLFMEMAPQMGPKLERRAKGRQFDWENKKVKMRLELLEIAKIIQKILKKDPNEIKSFHDSEKATSTLSVTSYNDGTVLRIGNKGKEEGAELNAVRIYLDSAEAFLLSRFLDKVLNEMFVVRINES